MPISHVGTSPASTLNLGLGATATGLGVKAAQLGFDVTKLTASLDTQAAISLGFPPDTAAYGAAFLLGLNPVQLASTFTPTTWASVNVTTNADLVADLALLEAQITILEPIAADLRAGVDAGGLSGWSYAGTAAGYGTELQAASARGYGGVATTDDVSGLIIATDAFTSWGSFSIGFNTGDSTRVDLGDNPSSDRLRSLVATTGGDWSTGVRGQLPGLELLLESLNGQRATILAQLDVSAGLNLPDPTAVVDAGLEIDLTAALDNLVNVQTDLDAGISGLNARINAIVSLAANLNAQLSAGGFSLWSYSGPAGQIGAAFAPEVAGGLPGVGRPRGPAYGIVIVGSLPSAWGQFGRIFAT